MKKTAHIAIAALLALGLSACDRNEGPAEEAGEEIDQAVEEAGEAIEEAGDKIREETEQ
jgi:hypothetical protein